MTASHFYMPRLPIPRRQHAPPPAPLGRRERHKTDVRNRLLRAAFELFATRGFQATTVEDITQAADVAKGTFFNYFSTKELLLAQMAEHRLDILRAALAEAQLHRISSRELLYRLLLALVDEPRQSRGMARCMLLGPLSAEPVVSVAGTTIARGRQILRDTIALGQRRGEIRRDWSSAELAVLFQQAFFGALYLWVVHPNLNLSRCLDRTFAQFWAGARAREGTRRREVAPRKGNHEAAS
jgi:TetR/AcrR family transcriptional regulator, cholesterol catabolism regulator